MREVISIHIGQAGIQVSGGGKPLAHAPCCKRAPSCLWQSDGFLLTCSSLEQLLTRCVRMPIESGLPVTAGGKCLLGTLLPGAR